ncbi:hypothetical protein TVAG_064300 [Trichomonas vaginalis G3]|uniref:Uncharacterized protein n=1 Tax=Trichomonas vaginalis (strain ATCC PRA-98 / G3) TaxID=412133 RepID=A2FBZ0_TRIV3|nr:hypothetical protein TVAGG3_0488400 [Trichomonas vaginalis G3]EAX97589.1 hypothetical protein TVAG_064300 [Trichomonas vaginalis G3]KAI5516202.1 hypothetical protein TVAGG3_0488400 [Trichomonas vaginalis G3]|eukprot:XP_001310519.1 hypothetical protein [Trichomonas vaginalis G3]
MTALDSQKFDAIEKRIQEEFGDLIDAYENKKLGFQNIIETNNRISNSIDDLQLMSAPLVDFSETDQKLRETIEEYKNIKKQYESKKETDVRAINKSTKDEIKELCDKIKQFKKSCDTSDMLTRISKISRQRRTDTRSRTERTQFFLTSSKNNARSSNFNVYVPYCTQYNNI